MNNARLALMALSLALAPAVLPAGLVAQQKKSRDVLTREEILQSAQKSKDLYEALRALKPRFLNPLTTRSNNPNVAQREPLVVIDGARSGGVGTLRSIMAETVEEVRFMAPTEAASEYGPDGAGGAIVVKLYKHP